MDKSKEFIKWLAKKMNLKSDQEVKAALQKMGDQGIREKFEQYESEIGDGETESMEQGGKLDYVKCLQEFKKGGSMKGSTKKCSCGSKMEKGSKIPKAFLGAILGGATKVGKLAGTVGKIGKIADTVGKVGQAVNTVKGVMTPMMSPRTVSMVEPSQVPSAAGAIPVTQTTTPQMSERTIPQVKMEDGGEVKNNKLEKLKSLRTKKKPVKK